MKRTMLLSMLMLVLTASFAAAQEVEIPVIFDRSWMDSISSYTPFDPERIEIEKVKDADLSKSEIALSPDGQWIAFLSGDTCIWIVPAEGGEPRLVYEIPEDQLLYFAPEDYIGYYTMFYGHIRMITFSPDGEEITFCRAYYDPLKGSDYYFAEKTAASSGIRNLILTIESVNIATGEVHTIIEEGTCPSWSANGRYLAYVHNDHMVYLDPSQAKYDGVPSIYDTVTGETRHLFDVNSTVSYNDPDPFKAQRTGKVYWGVELTVDNSEMICSLQTDSEDASSYSLTRINVETGEETEITKTAARSLFLKRSPGGRYMVYSGYPFGFATMMVDLETNEIIRAFTTESEDGRGVFTPDGSSMIYLKYYDFESTSIKVGHATMICSQPIDPAARFASGITGMPAEIPADYGILPEFGTQVSDKDASFVVTGAPLWSPDGTVIFFTDSSGQIWSAPLDGGEETLIYDNPVVMYQDYPVAIRQVNLYGFTPDGSEILFSRNAIDEERGSTPELRYAGDRIVGAGWSNGLSYLYAVNVETGAVRTVVVGGEYGVYSPDGRYLAYTVNEFKGVTGDTFLDEHRNQIIVRNLETGEETFIPITLYQRFYWTPDSSALFMHASPTEFRKVPIDGSNSESYSMKTSYHYSLDPAHPFLVLHESGVLYGVNYLTGERTRITPDVDGEFSYPVLSPDGTKLACLVTYEGVSAFNPYQVQDRRHIFIMDIDTRSLMPTAVEDVAPAPELVIGNYPNPFNPTTAIIFSLPGDGMTQLDIYNLSGQKVRELVYGRMNKGVHIVSWDGHTTDGSQAASGIYIARISMGNHVATRRMTLMK